MAEKPTAKRSRSPKVSRNSKKKPGPKPIPFTPEQHEQVAGLYGYGLPQEKICLLIPNPRTGKPITVETLQKYFGADLELGRAKAWAQSLQTSYNLAHGIKEVRQIGKDGKVAIVREEVKPNSTHMIWFQKSQMGAMEEEAKVRTEIARRVAELKGIMDSGEDPHETAKRIKEELDKLEESVTGAARPASK